MGAPSLGLVLNSAHLGIRFALFAARVRGSFCECAASKFMYHLIRVLTSWGCGAGTQVGHYGFGPEIGLSPGAALLVSLAACRHREIGKDTERIRSGVWTNHPLSLHEIPTGSSGMFKKLAEEGGGRPPRSFPTPWVSSVPSVRAGCHGSGFS